MFKFLKSFSLPPLSEFVSEAPPVDKSLDWIFHQWKLFKFENGKFFEMLKCLSVLMFQGIELNFLSVETF